jgi:hypothetical protein
MRCSVLFLFALDGPGAGCKSEKLKSILYSKIVDVRAFNMSLLYSMISWSNPIMHVSFFFYLASSNALMFNSIPIAGSVLSLPQREKKQRFSTVSKLLSTKTSDLYCR